MAKKYLLYIHDDEQFSGEEHKSALVNQLLDSYYMNFTETKHVSVQQLPKGGTGVFSTPRVITQPEEVVGVLGGATKLCKHGKSQNMCKVQGCPHYF